MVVSSVKTKSKDPTHLRGSESPTVSARHYGSSSLPSPQKPPFGCCCGKCTLSSFIERGCPAPLTSRSMFPYLKLGELTDEQQEDLKERLRYESQEIMMRFQELVSITIESLIGRNVSLDRLVSHVMTLGAFDPVYINPQLPIFQECRKELKTADSIPKIFLVLQDYFSFFNYEIIEHIIKVLGTEQDKAELQRYKIKFNQYVKRRIYECQPRFGPESERDHPNIFVKLDSRYDNYTSAEIKRFCRKLSEILHVLPQGVLRLCRVEKGCIQLIFQVPSFVQQKIFPLTREQERMLEAMGIISFTCGEYHFLVPERKDSTEKPLHGIDTSGKLVDVAISVKANDICLHDPLTVGKVKTFEPVWKKLQLDTDPGVLDINMNL